MALTIKTATDEAISLEEFAEYVREDVNPLDIQSVIASSEKFRALANNQTFLIDRLNQDLINWSKFQTENTHTAQTLMLGGGKEWYIRANMWAPASPNPKVNEWQDQLYYYLRPHDHNFSFLTVGYFGPGYGTSIYEYDSESIAGEPGETVKLQFLEHTTLTRGKVMLYRASQDIHSQEHPLEFSISLNLMLTPPTVYVRDQYYFNTERGILTDVAMNPGTGRLFIIEAARYFGDSETVCCLETLAASHPSPRVRAKCYESFAMLESDSAETIWKKAFNDQHKYVKMHAARALQEIEQL